MNWLILFTAGLLEVVWAVGLKYTHGFTRIVPSVITVAAMAGSVLLLGIALRTLPLGTAYAVWVGIGAVGAAVCGMMLFSEAVTTLKVVSLVCIVAGIVGLKVATSA